MTSTCNQQTPQGGAMQTRSRTYQERDSPSSGSDPKRQAVAPKDNERTQDTKSVQAVIDKGLQYLSKEGGAMAALGSILQSMLLLQNSGINNLEEAGARADQVARDERKNLADRLTATEARCRQLERDLQTLKTLTPHGKAERKSLELDQKIQPPLDEAEDINQNLVMMLNGEEVVQPASPRDSYANILHRSIDRDDKEQWVKPASRKTRKKKTLVPLREHKVIMIKLDSDKMLAAAKEAHEAAPVERDHNEADRKGMEQDDEENQNQYAGIGDWNDIGVIDNQKIEELIVCLDYTESRILKALREKFGKDVAGVAYRRSDCSYLKVFTRWSDVRDPQGSILATVKSYIDNPATSPWEQFFSCTTEARKAKSGSQRNSVLMFGPTLGPGDRENYEKIIKELLCEHVEKLQISSVEKWNCERAIYQIFLKDQNEVKNLLGVNFVRYGGRTCYLRTYKPRGNNRRQG